MSRIEEIEEFDERIESLCHFLEGKWASVNSMDTAERTRLTAAMDAFDAALDAACQQEVCNVAD